MFDNKSDYALNKKDQDSIVYCGSDGYVAHITRADFSSEEEFLFWKSWSDADYKETDYADSYFHRHTVGLDTVGDNAGNIPSPGEMLLYKAEREEQVQEAMKLVRVIAESLTEVQFRRLWLHHVRRVNVRSIAKAEGVAHPASWQVLHLPKRKFSKSCRNTLPKRVRE